jgi:hypothetical protein
VDKVVHEVQLLPCVLSAMRKSGRRICTEDFDEGKVSVLKSVGTHNLPLLTASTERSGHLSAQMSSGQETQVMCCNEELVLCKLLCSLYTKQ